MKFDLLSLTRPALMPRLADAAPWTWTPERRRSVARRVLRRLGIALAALLAIWLLLWLAVPPLLKWQAQQRLSTLLGRTVTIGQVQFAPWSLELTLRDVAIAGPSGNAAPLFHAERLYADADWRSLFRFAPVIAAIEIDAPHVNLARTAPGRYDIDDIVERLKPAPQPQGEPSSAARFALYNVQVRDGALAFDDKPVGRRHAIDKLLLRLPFLSTLPSQVEITVEPRLAFTFDGASFDTGAQTTPFAPDRETSMTLKMGDFDLAIVKPYLPPEVPVDLQRGRVQADLSLRFALRDGSTPSLSLRGAVKVSDLALAERGGAALASWRTLQVALDDVRPLERRAALGTVRFEGLDVSLTRDAQGRVNLLQLVPPRAAPPVAGASGAASAASAAAPAAVAQSNAAWQLTLRTLELGDARVRWHDALTEPNTTWSIDGIEAKVAPITWPATEPATLALKAQLHESGREVAAATLAVQGSATPTQASVGVRVDDADLGVLAPYLALLIKPRVEGRAALDTRIDWAAQPEVLTVHLANAAIDGLRVIDAQQRARFGERKARDALAWKRAELADVQLDVPARKLAIGRIALVDPQSVLERRADGGLNVVQWAQPAPSAAAALTPGAAAVREAATTQWQVALSELTITGGQLLWRDDAVPGGTPDDPVRLDVHAIRATVNGFSWPVATAQAQVQLSAQVADPAAQREQRRVRGGSIDWNGRVVAQPLAVRGALRIERFPIHALERYATGGLNASLQRGQLQWRGDVALRQRPAGIEAHVAGDLLLADLHVFGRDPATLAVSPDELIGWQALNVKGLKVALAPPARPRIDTDEAVLSDFYSQLVLSEEGRFNLRDVARPAGPATPPGGFAVGPQIAPAASAAQAEAQPKPEPKARAASAASPAASEARGGRLPVDVAVGGLQLVNGRVDYTDRLIKPNYSAALSDLNGRLGAFDSTSRDMATLELAGRIAGTGSLDVRGNLNPMADPLALDVGAKASEIELAPLSPYAGKYAGYAIERGKLSMDVHYSVQPDGRLDATNHVVLNQLTFGEHIESPTATKLPVRLAVALLSDRNGVIDVNLPISGSINDPQFSVGGIIVKIIVNLIVKVVTAPFSWLAGGGAEDLSTIAFRPGTATMVDSASAALDKVAKALQERPSLQMTVTGTADAAVEADAIRDAMLEQRLLAQRRNEALRSGSAASAPQAMPPDERERLLRSVYRDTDLPDKPRNVIGFAKDIPAPEMEALLKKHMRVNEDTARQLALQRGLTVRDALVAKGLPSERMFLAAPKLRTPGQDDGPWAPRAQLSLAVR
jgi:uncharacterized protein involved in outer membrane biogenesis